MIDFSAQHGPPPSAKLAIQQLAAEACQHLSDEDAVDIYGNGSVLQLLEGEVAACLGKQAAAFVTTGTAANQACVRAAAQDTSSHPHVMLHPTSHLVHLDCLLDGIQQGSTATLEERAQVNLLGIKPVFFGEMHRCANSHDVESTLQTASPDVNVLVLEVPQVTTILSLARGIA